MRNRLIERLTKSKKGSLGYTMIELLVVIGIIAVLCAIAIPGIIYIRNSLRFAQANNYAKSIFLAAQQNLTELRSDGGLGPVQAAGGAYTIPDAVTTFPDEFRNEYRYTITGTEAFSRILPAGSIDADIRDDQIVIEYNPITGNVYSVFYFEKGVVSSGFNLANQYSGGGLPREEGNRRKLMVGYYDGSGLNSAQIELEQTQAQVEFINDQEGIIRVKIPMPESYYGDFQSYCDALNVSLTITGDYSSALAAENGTPIIPLVIEEADALHGYQLDVDGKTVVMEYAIDSLADCSSFANYISNTQKHQTGTQVNSEKPLTSLADETEFTYTILPGENITIQADVTFQGNGQELVQVSPGILSGINPMFESLVPGSETGRYVLTIANGRNLQNLNALTPTIAKLVESVVFVRDINWNDTVNYYNASYGTVQGSSKVYTNSINEAPARRLPYFVPIHNAALFGTAKFDYPNSSWADKINIPDSAIKDLIIGIFNPQSRVPTLTDEFDPYEHAKILGSDQENMDAVQIRNLNIDSTKNPVGKAFYAGTADADIDRFTGLFSYVNTSIDNIHVVNPIVKGYKFVGSNNPATGALLGAGGYSTLITNCAAYLDTSDPAFSYTKMMAQSAYNPDSNNNQSWYGVSGEGSVGGLVGYAKSHRTTTGALDPDMPVLAFHNSFAAVNVSGNLRPEEEVKDKVLGFITVGKYYGYKDKDYGYSNGVGGFIGSSHLTNFYTCYASGNVMATNPNAADNFTSKGESWLNKLLGFFGVSLEIRYGGRESAGVGGFVGTSHGTRYSNCFSTGTVTGSGSSSKLGAGGFVGTMCIDETHAYGNQDDTSVNVKYIQRTVFTNCYSVGLVTLDGTRSENFSGATCRTTLDISEFGAAQVADYYRLLAPHYVTNDWSGRNTLPDYEDFYIYKDSYYLSDYYPKDAPNSNNCATPIDYDTLTDLPGSHQDDNWIQIQIKNIKSIKLYDSKLFKDPTYDNTYFQNNSKLETAYVTAYKQGYRAGWGPASAATTHGYDMNGTYPFSKLTGLDYYGDWPSKPLDYGVAYYEVYDGSNLKNFYFDRESTSNLRSDAGNFVVKDGYAILSSTNSTMKINVNGIEKVWESTSEGFTAGTRIYYAYVLTDKQMEAAVEYVRTTGQFYVPIKVTQDRLNSTFYFNPIVAKSQVNGSFNHTFIDEKSDNKCDKCRNTVNHQYHLPSSKNLIIRSARQFAALDTMTGFFGSEYHYVQQLSIDADKYQWYNDNDKKLSAIGTEQKPFDAAYTGYYIDSKTYDEKSHSISGFQLSDSGIFGYIGQKGSVSDLIVNFATVKSGSDQMDSTAILAAVNNGTLDNVTLNLSGDVTLTAKTNTGLLAGLSTGTITNCAVNAEKNVSMNAVNAGGLIGSAVGTSEVQAAVVNTNLTLDGKLTVGTARYAGGLIGSAEFTFVNNTTVSMTGLNTQAAYAGGLAGYAKNCTIVGSSDSGDREVTITDSLTAADHTAGIQTSGKDTAKEENGYAAGILASGENTTLTGVDLSAMSISGNIAAGFLGNGTNIDPSNCTVKITQAITGRTGAAGVAGTIGSGSVFNRVPVDLSGAKVSASAGNAAGYALMIEPEAMVMGQSNVTLNKATNTPTISASGNAAGFACTINGSAGDVRVAGKGNITGSNAAGFACTVNGALETAHVSPALNNDAYKGNSNSNLTVNGSDSAAGFVLSLGEKGVVSNCYTLCTVSSDGKIQIEKKPESPAETTAPTEPVMESVSSAYGFVGTNAGTISRCMANVTLTKGFAFSGINNSLIASCYGWYGDGVSDAPCAVRVEAAGDGTCNSSYFVELDPMDRAGQCATVYHTDGTLERMTSTMLQNVGLSGFVTGYNEYPYSTMNPADYPFPMLRDHYGDWVKPPQYAYGVAYYETYADGTTKLHMVDLSDKTLTVENEKGIIVSRNGGFNSDGTINETGYAMFYNTLVGMDEAEKLFSYTVSDGYTYDFYAIEADGPNTIPATIGQSKSAQINTWFADAIDVNDNFQIRTPEQLANISKRSANYRQTHDIATNDVTPATIASDTTYDGNGWKLTITGQTKTWLSEVAGTVTNLELEVTDAVNKPIFGTVSGTVNLNAVNLASIAQGGALVSTSNGTVNTGSITVGAMNGHLFDTISGATVTTGDINLASRTASMVGVFDSGTLQGDSQNKKSISLAGDAQTPLFSANVGGTVRNYSYTTGTMLGGLADTVDGELSSLTVTANGNADKAFVTVLNGTMKDVELNVTGSLNASAIGTNNTALSNVTLTAKSATVSDGVLVGSNEGSITDCDVTVKTVNAKGAVFGVVANKLDSGMSLTSSTVNVDNLIYSTQADAFVGGLVGTNAGTITDSTVSILAAQPATVEEPEEEITEPIEDEPTDPTEETGETQPAEPIAEELRQGVTLNGGKDFTLTFGGLTGTNSGAIESSKANVSITYVQPTETTDKAILGGLVGTMQGGTLTGTNASDATGTITLTGNAKGRAYVVGGAIGALTGGSAGTTSVNVSVAPEWAGTANRDGGSTYGSSGIKNNGPVGMFVGYAGNVTLTNCSSTEPSNATYQFLGEALIETTPLSGMWKSNVKKTGALMAYSDGVVDGVYTSYDPAGYTFSAAANNSRVAANLSGCFFRYRGTAMEQSYGVSEYYYSQTSSKENGYKILTSAVSPAISSKTINLSSKEYDNTPKATGYYYLDSTGKYCPVSVRYDGRASWLPGTFHLVETGNESREFASIKGSYNFAVYYEASVTLYAMSNATLNGLFASVKSNGFAIDSQGNEYTLPTKRAFDQRDDILNCIWNASGNTITNVADGTVYSLNVTFTKNNTPVMVYEVGGVSFHLYPVTCTANGSSYSILTFTYQDNANYQRQFITAK